MTKKVFRGKQLSSLITQIRAELGEGAEILSTRSLDSGDHEIEVALRSVRPVRNDSSYLLTQQLEKQGISEKLRRDVMEYLATQRKGLPDYLKAHIRFEPSIPSKGRALALVGPTGVGKTTTLAKLAAQLYKVYQIKIGFLSADTYRVGAVEHLQKYAEMLKMPFASISKEKQFARCLYLLRGCDLILIDTPGRSQREIPALEKLSATLRESQGIERYLVLSAPGNKVDLLHTTQAFRMFDYSRVILTKIDETGYLGPAVESIIEAKVPLAFFTTGQRVPEDIEPASAERLSWMLQRTIH